MGSNNEVIFYRDLLCVKIEADIEAIERVFFNKWATQLLLLVNGIQKFLAGV